MTTFGERLKVLANKLGKEDQDVAEDLGLSKSQMSHYTTGKRKVPSELLQKIVDVYKINPQFLFRENAPLYSSNKEDYKTTNPFLTNVNEEKVEYKVSLDSEYDFYPLPVSAGLPSAMDSLTENDIKQIAIPDAVMGKWSNREGVFVMRVNGDSMNRVMPHESLIAVKKVCLDNLQNNDIVVFSNDHEYSVKRYYNDVVNKRYIFSAESTDRSFIDHTVPYSEASNLMIHGKVVVYIVNLD